MVVKIQQSSGSMAGVIDYNEKKVEEGEACVVDIHGIQAPDRSAIEAEFQRLERRNIRSEKVSFHLSINPGMDDKMTEQEVIDFAAKMMDGLGYGSQPYVIYRHEDIERTHYHVVSIRVNEEGRKIRDRQEQRKCQSIMKQMQKEYSFSIGNDEKNLEKIVHEQKSTDSGNPGQGVPVIPIFLTGEQDVISTMNAAFDDALSYHYTTWPQFQWVMRSHGIETDITGTEDNKTLTFQGLDQDGQPCSAIMTEKDLGRPLHEQFFTRMEECGKEDRKREKNRAGNAVRMCTQNASGEEELKVLLSQKGLDLHLSRGKDGVLFGTTIIDHKTKCAFKGSELGREISAMIKNCCEVPSQQTTAEPQISQEVQQEVQEQKSSSLDISSALLTVMGAFLTSSRGRHGAGKDPKKKKKKKRR